MCRRYYLKSDKEAIAVAFGVSVDLSTITLPDWNYNVAEQTEQPIVRNNLKTGERELVKLGWGMIPFSLKSLDGFKANSTTNCRSETIFGDQWLYPFKRRRCLVPADGFYYWPATTRPSILVSGVPLRGFRPKSAMPIALSHDEGKAFAVQLKNCSTMAFAGLWDRWRDPKGGEDAPLRETFAIITTKANDVVSPLQNRMPVIIASEDYERWLDCRLTVTRAPKYRPPFDLLRPYPADKMEAVPCNPRVRDTQQNFPDLLRPQL
jgi:putative SOS response-associated peptidase YedK